MMSMLTVTDEGCLRVAVDHKINTTVHVMHGYRGLCLTQSYGLRMTFCGCCSVKNGRWWRWYRLWQKRKVRNGKNFVAKVCNLRTCLLVRREFTGIYIQALPRHTYISRWLGTTRWTRSCLPNEIQTIYTGVIYGCLLPLARWLQ